MDMPMHGLAQHPPLGAPAHQDHGTCPYAASPALAALPALTSLPLAMQAALPPAAATPQIAYFELVARAQSPRGPPLEV